MSDPTVLPAPKKKRNRIVGGIITAVILGTLLLAVLTVGWLSRDWIGDKFSTLATGIGDMLNGDDAPNPQPPANNGGSQSPPVIAQTPPPTPPPVVAATGCVEHVFVPNVVIADHRGRPVLVVAVQNGNNYRIYGAKTADVLVNGATVKGIAVYRDGTPISLDAVRKVGAGRKSIGHGATAECFGTCTRTASR